MVENNKSEYLNQNLPAQSIYPPLVRALVSLLPYVGGPLEIAAEEIFTRISERRRKVFFDELSSGMRNLSEELVHSEDFLHCYFATYRAAMRARRDEKIKFLANLLSGAVRFNGENVTDEYEELLSIVDELSFRELNLLVNLSNAPNPGPYKESDMPANLCAFGFQREESSSVLYRLLRSGLIGVTYEPASDGFWDKKVEGRWYFTSRLAKLKELVASAEIDPAQE